MDAAFFTAISEKNLNQSSKTRISSNPIKGMIRLYPLAETKDIKIYDASGNLVKNFKNPQGPITWDGRDESGKRLASGIYFINLNTPKGNLSEKVLFVR